MYYAYDIVVNEENNLEVNIYKVDLIREGKKTFYRFSFIKSIPVLNGELNPIIKKLKVNDVVSIIRFKDSDFSCEFSNTKYSYQSFFLSTNHQMLEKVFDEVIMDNICYIHIYITYVNVNNGEVKALKMDDFGQFTEEKETILKQLGFKHIANSYLGNYLDKINTSNKKPFTLKRRKKN